MSHSGDAGDFRISSFSGGGNCIAVGRTAEGRIGVRHSHAPDVTLAFSESEWEAFVKGVKAGEFDSL